MSIAPVHPGSSCSADRSCPEVRNVDRTHDFWVGSDGALDHAAHVDPRLVRTVHHAARLAAQLDDVLGVGDLRRLRTTGATGATEVDADVLPAAGAECLVRGNVRSGSPPLPALPTVPSGSDPHRSAFVAAQLDAATAEARSATGAIWSAVLRHDLVPLRIAGDLDDDAAARLASRVLSMLHALGRAGTSRSPSTVTLEHARGTLVVAPVGPHALCFLVTELDAPLVRTTVDRVRTMLDGLELASAAPRRLQERSRAPRGIPEDEVDWVREDWLEPEFAFPIGARFAGTGPRAPRRRKPRPWSPTDAPSPGRSRFRRAKG